MGNDGKKKEGREMRLTMIMNRKKNEKKIIKGRKVGKKKRKGDR